MWRMWLGLMQRPKAEQEAAAWGLQKHILPTSQLAPAANNSSPLTTFPRDFLHLFTWSRIKTVKPLFKDLSLRDTGQHIWDKSPEGTG